MPAFWGRGIAMLPNECCKRRETKRLKRELSGVHRMVADVEELTGRTAVELH